MIENDIRLAKLLYDLVDNEPDFEAFQSNLSITTFRYVPHSGLTEEQLNELNQRLMVALQSRGEVFVTNAVKKGKYLLRACIVNFRTRDEDIYAFPEIVRRTYHEM